MTIFAIANVQGGTNVGFSGATDYNVQYQMAASDGTNFVQNLMLSNFAIPIGTSPKKADTLIRQALATLLQQTNGWVIDPDDIYIPFAAD